MSGAAAQTPSPALMPEDSPLSLAVNDAPIAPVAHVQQVIAPPVNMVTPRRPKRRRKAEPVRDEWGFFDPNQCGFSALIARLDEIAGRDESDN